MEGGAGPLNAFSRLSGGGSDAFPSGAGRPQDLLAGIDATDPDPRWPAPLRLPGRTMPPGSARAAVGGRPGNIVISGVFLRKMASLRSPLGGRCGRGPEQGQSYGSPAGSPASPMPYPHALPAVGFAHRNRRNGLRLAVERFWGHGGHDHPDTDLDQGSNRGIPLIRAYFHEKWPVFSLCRRLGGKASKAGTVTLFSRRFAGGSDPFPKAEVSREGSCPPESTEQAPIDDWPVSGVRMVQGPDGSRHGSTAGRPQRSWAT